VDLNADLGEGMGDPGSDEALLDVVTSANIACGFHAGDALLMRRTVRAAVDRDVAIGAHVSYPDRANFGRTETGAPPEQIEADVRRSLGIPDLPMQVHKITRWSVDAVMASGYQVDRAFLIGDAAHRHPPTGGLGLTSAIQDAHNLCWKLHAVLAGHATPATVRLTAATNATSRPHPAPTWAATTLLAPSACARCVRSYDAAATATAPAIAA